MDTLYSTDMDSLKDLLSQYRPQEPDEIMAIKRYILDEFGAEASVALKGDALQISVSSASLANALRLRLPALQKAANTKKRIFFRVN